MRISDEKSMSSSHLSGCCFRLSVSSGSDVVPVDETLSLMASGARHVIYEDAARSRFCIHVDDGFAALAVDAHLAVAVMTVPVRCCRQLMGVVAQEVVRLQGEVVAQSGEVLVMDTAAYAAPCCGCGRRWYHCSAGCHLEWRGHAGLETVLSAQLLHVHLAGGVEVAHQVDVAQVAHQIHLSFRPCLGCRP